MRKKRSKRKNRQRKKKIETVKAVIKNKQNQEQDEVMEVDKGEQAQRRTIRVGAVIGIVAVVGTLCVFLWKKTISLLNIWPQGGMIYWYLYVLFFIALSTGIIIFADLLFFILSDLKRYNVADHSHKQYDEVSDSRYLYLVKDFKIYTIILLIAIVMLIPLSAIYGEEWQQWFIIGLSFFSVALGIILIIRWIKKKSKDTIRQNVKYVLCRLMMLMTLVILCFVVGITSVINGKATISITYGTDGYIEICNASSEGYGELEIKILDKNREIIYIESVEKEKLLFARETKYVNNEFRGKTIAEGIVINSELLHWKYMFDLKTQIKKSNQYYVYITIYQDGKKVVLMNMFNVENGRYTFAKDSMTKDY